MFTFRLKAVKALVLAGIIGGVVVSCQEANVADSSIASTNVQEITKVANTNIVPPKHWETLTLAADKQAINNDLIALTKAVALTVNDAALQQALHKAALEKFDGDTEVLWTALNNNTAINARASQSNARNWSALVAQKADKSVFASADAVSAAVSRASKAYNANVHLYWFNAEKWDKTTTPIVAFVPVGCDPEKENIILSGYDAKGKKYAVDKEFALKNPVIVINANERTNADGTVLEGFMPGAQNAIKNSSTKGGAGLQSNTTLSLIWTSFSGQANEGWFNGNPEFWVSIQSVNAQNPGVASFQWGSWECGVDWWRCDGQQIYWFGPWQRSAPWNQNLYKTFVFKWMERDSGVSWEFNVSGSYKIDNGSVTVGGKVSGKDQDDELGVATVNLDDATRTYYTGMPSFELVW